MYRSKDFNNIMLSIESIKNAASEKYKSTYEPTMAENFNIFIEIKKYIIQKNRIVYGGIAQNLLINTVDNKECFYTERNGVYYNWPDIADIEFYSVNPTNDIIDICELLLEKKFVHIIAKEGVKLGTVKLFVNYVNYCDITYMPQNIYNNLPTTKIKKIRCINPHFMLIDAFRVLTDPLGSYWRLDKTIVRFQKILQFYNYDKSLIKKSIKYIECNDIIINDIILFITTNIIINSKLIIIGYYAFNYYINKINKKDSIINIPYFEIITDSLVENGNNIYKILSQKYKNKITIKEFYPFFQFLDNKIEYYYNNILILILYGNNKRCTVYNYLAHSKIYIGTFNLVLMYYLINYYYSVINKIYYQSNAYLTIISKMHYYKIIYLNKTNKSILDETPFKDFTLNCFGVVHETRRENRLRMDDKKIKKFIYVPSGDKKYLIVSYNNISGNQIFENKNKFILKNI